MFSRYASIAPSSVLSTSIKYKEQSLGLIPHYIASDPFGFGLATAGPATTFGGKVHEELEGHGVTAETEYNLIVDELGLPGLVLFVGLMLMLGALVLRGLPQVADTEARIELAAVFAPVFALAIMGLRGAFTDDGRRWALPVVRARGSPPTGLPATACAAAWRSGGQVMRRRRAGADASPVRGHLLPLLGERRGLIAALALTSICSGFTEAAHAGRDRAGRGGARQRQPAGGDRRRADSRRRGDRHSVGVALALTAASPAPAVPDLDPAGANRSRRAVAAAPQAVSHLQSSFMGGAVARSRGAAAGDDDKPGDAGDRRLAAGDHLHDLRVHLRRADDQRARFEPGGGGDCVVGLAALDRSAAAAAVDRRQACACPLAGTDALRGRHQRGDQDGRGDARVRRRRGAASADRHVRAGLLAPRPGTRSCSPSWSPTSSRALSTCCSSPGSW